VPPGPSNQKRRSLPFSSTKGKIKAKKTVMLRKTSPIYEKKSPSHKTGENLGGEKKKRAALASAAREEK